MDEQERRGSVAKGIGIALGADAVALFIAFLTIMIGGGVLILGIGLVQLLWMAPLVVVYRRKSEFETAKGFVIAAAIVFVLNAGCWGLVAR